MMDISNMCDNFFFSDGKKRRKVMGVGVADENIIYSRNPNNKTIMTDPFYTRWSGMLRMCIL